MRVWRGVWRDKGMDGCGYGGMRVWRCENVLVSPMLRQSASSHTAANLTCSVGLLSPREL